MASLEKEWRKKERECEEGVAEKEQEKVEILMEWGKKVDRANDDFNEAVRQK